MPKGYIIAELNVTDMEGIPGIPQTKCRPSSLAYGGRYLVRAGEAQVLEGSGESGRMVVLEFDSPERRWSGTTPPNIRRSCRSACVMPPAGRLCHGAPPA